MFWSLLVLTRITPTFSTLPLLPLPIIRLHTTFPVAVPPPACLRVLTLSDMGPKTFQFLLVPVRNAYVDTQRSNSYPLFPPCPVCSYTFCVICSDVVYRCGPRKHACGFMPSSVAVVFPWDVRASCCVVSTAFPLFWHSRTDTHASRRCCCTPRSVLLTPHSHHTEDTSHVSLREFITSGGRRAETARRVDPPLCRSLV